MHLLGFAYASRFWDLHDNRLFIQGKADKYLALQSTTPTITSNIMYIRTDQVEILRLPTSTKQ